MAHVVIDVEYAELLLARPADVLQHIARLAHRKRRRRLVEEKQLCAEVHGARDRHRLPLAPRHRPDRLIGRADAGEAELGDRLLGLASHRAALQDTERSDLLYDLLAEEEVPPEAELIHYGKILVDSLDADGARIGRGPEAHVAAHEAERAGSRPLVAGEDLEERGFSRAIVTDERHDLAWPDRQVDVEDHLVAAVAVRDTPQLEDRFAGAVDLMRDRRNRRGSFGVQRRAAHPWLPPKRPRRTLAITTTTSMTPMKVT
jgi:hypothetical protein